MQLSRYLFFILILSSQLFAQGEVALEISNLINKGEIQKAEEKVEYYLKKDPNNVDAIMMKGNIILNKIGPGTDLLLNVNDNESIYETAIGYIMGNENRIVPKEKAREIAQIWKSALKVDNSREDIHYGICQIYSMSLLIDELISYLPILKSAIKTDEQLHYSMCDYARNIKNRGDFNGGMKVYKAIFQLYPDKSGLLSDIAAEYYLSGNLDSASHYIGLALKESNLDPMSYGNASTIFSELGRYHDALEALKKQSKLNNDQEYLFYQGLLEYLENKPEWKGSFHSYIKTGTDSIFKSFAQIFSSPDFSETYETYKKLTESDMPDAYKILIHHKFKDLNLHKLSPWFNYAESFTHAKYYTKAEMEFAQIEKSNLITSKKDSETVAFYYGWTLWSMDKKKESLSKWEQLFNSEDFYFKSAGAYFTGKYYLENNQPEKAEKYFQLVSKDASKSKYATYCNNLLERSH